MPNAKIDKIIVLTKSFLISLVSIVEDFSKTPASGVLEDGFFLAGVSPPDFSCARSASTSRLNSLVFFVSGFDMSESIIS